MRYVIFKSEPEMENKSKKSFYNSKSCLKL